MTREEAKLIGVTTVPNRGLEYVWYENYINKIDKIYDYFKLELEAEYKRGQDSMLSRTCESCKFYQPETRKGTLFKRCFFLGTVGEIGYCGRWEAINE